MAWKKMRCNRTLVDHFLREGHYTSAMLLAQSCDIEVIDGSVDRFCAYNLYHSVHVPLYGIYFVGMKSWLPMGWLEDFSSFFCFAFSFPLFPQHLVDVKVFQVCQHVEEGLRSRNTGPCLAWCHENRSKLRRLKSTLEYRVRLQDFTELVRQDRRIEAVK